MVTVDPKGELPRRFMNASVTQLSAFVHAYDEYCSLVRAEGDDDSARALVERLRDTLAALDPLALSGPETWWSVVLEQAIVGQL